MVDLTTIFNHGLTAKNGGNGFDLRSGRFAASEMDGSLNADSDSSRQGATFTLQFADESADRICSTKLEGNSSWRSI